MVLNERGTFSRPESDGAHFMHKMLRYFTNETRRRRIDILAIQHSVFGASHYQFLPRPRDTNITKPALFLELAFFIQ